jgi:repressor LexA
MAKGLTDRQQAILDYIVECIRENGYPPTIAEIGLRFSIASTNGVNDHLQSLERKGYITRAPKARGIHVNRIAAQGLYQSDVGVAPLVGRVAAGYPILAEENIEAEIPVAGHLSRGKVFCLRVSGDSMIEDGILDGDIIVVDQDRKARTGDIVVALIEDEATVKHYHPRGGNIELRPANRTMQPMVYAAGQVSVQGVVVGLQRAY